MAGQTSGRSSGGGAVPWMLAAFIAGFFAVLIFHQGLASLLHAAGLTPNRPFALRATRPFGVPLVVSASFWGGVWGIALAWVLRRAGRRSRDWAIAFVFGALGPTLVAWYVVAPLRGLPAAGGWQALPMARGLILNGAWGLGTALLLRLCAPAALSRRSP